MRTSPFIKTSPRGSTYYAKGGKYWIRKTGSKWSLISVARSSGQASFTTVAQFPTLAAAVTYYKEGNR
jgi:hypothetical protein